MWILCGLMGLLPCAADETATFAELVQKVERPAGFPAPSAVCFSSRWKHPSNAKDPHDTFASAAAFHATGFYWCNGPSAEYFREIKRRGYPVQGWLSTILPDKLFGNTRQVGRILDQQGNLVTGPWMLAWKGWWGCMNSPEYRQVYLEYIKMYLDAGVDLLQMDDPGENLTAVRWGGCYCPYCRATAEQRGQTPPEIQGDVTIDFYRDMRREMNAIAGRHVPFSCNSHPGSPYFFDEIFDFGLQELGEAHSRPARFYTGVREAEQRGKAMMYTYVSTDLGKTRYTIALAYACGTQIIVPWDVYMPNGKPRQFGEPQDYADLYGFARANAALLDGYEDAAALAPRMVDHRFELPPLSVSGGSDELCLFARAKPGDPDAPVVIHAVETGDQAQPCRLRLDAARLFGNRPVTIELLTPAPYDEAAHAKAEETKDFSALVVRKRLAEGFVNAVEVPALSPWGLLVVSPLAQTAGVMPPYVVAEPASLGSGTLLVRFTHPDPSATLRYTLDGTQPTATSTRYDQPLKLDQATTVQAKAFGGGTASAAAAVQFRRTAGAVPPAEPGAVPGLCLWLRAEDLGLAANAPVESWPARLGPALSGAPVTLFDKRRSTPPVYVPNGLGGRPVVRFSDPTALLHLQGFADQHLTGAFTLLYVARSDDELFGLSGNGINGGGGIPRLYLKLDGFTYHASTLGTGGASRLPALLTYTHDGDQTGEVYLNGERTGKSSDEGWQKVPSYGSGGALAMPTWVGNVPHLGDLAEVVVYDRCLSEAERRGVEQELSARYGLPCPAVWE